MKTILVVDDDAHILDATSMILEDAGYRVLSAPDGLQGLAMARSEKPDLIVLDLAMPGMHGFEVCKSIKNDPALRHIKIVIASGKNYPTDIKTAAQLGADKYMVKPYDFDAFKKLIAELLSGVAERAR